MIMYVLHDFLLQLKRTGFIIMSVYNNYNTSIKIIKNEVGCRDDTVPKTVDTRRHCACEEE